jgi:hypothetical protein
VREPGERLSRSVRGARRAIRKPSRLLPGTDTRTSTGRLMIGVLGGLADVERDLIRTPTAEGRGRAKVQGQHMGRSQKLTRSSRKKPASGARKGLRSKSCRDLQCRPGDDFTASGNFRCRPHIRRYHAS